MYVLILERMFKERLKVDVNTISTNKVTKNNEDRNYEMEEMYRD